MKSFILLLLLCIPIHCHASFVDDVHWLSLNIYHEARSEPDKGKFAVALTTLNRVRDSRYPSDIKGVVTQKDQFSWYWDGKSDKTPDIHSWNKSLYISIITMLVYNHMETENYLWYHNNTVTPTWSKKLKKLFKIGKHQFYTEK